MQGRKSPPRAKPTERTATAEGKTMKIIVSGKQMSVRESLKLAIEKKLAKFNKFFDDSTEAFVTCKARKGVKIIEITISYGGTLFRSEEESDTFLTALDRSMESLERQIRKNKTRLEKTIRQGAFLVEEPDYEDEWEEEGEFNIRTKSYPNKPMTPEEAILQMNLLGHAFFAFWCEDFGGTCVVYKRKDGDYGMIVPEND